MPTTQHDTTTAPPVDPAVDAPSPEGWRRWLTELGHHEPIRFAESGGILVAGFGAAALLLYTFAWLAYKVLGEQTQAVDLATLGYLQQFTSPYLTLAAGGVSLLGSEVILVVALVLLGLFVYQRRWGAAVTLIVVTAGAQVLNNLLKAEFQRARPTPVAGIISAQQFSFPSGHAMVAAAFYLYVAYLTWRLVRGRLWRTVLVTALVMLVVLIGLARLYLEAHYLSDVIAGYMAGLLWTDTVILGARILSTRPLGRLGPTPRVHSAR